MDEIETFFVKINWSFLFISFTAFYQLLSFRVPCLRADNTPSYGSTPIWRPNAIETPPSEPSPKDTKKQLIELFRESFNSEQERSSIANRHVELVNMEANDGKPITSRRSRSVKGKSAQSTPWCIPVPKLARSLSLGDKKKRLLSPCRGGGWGDLWARTMWICM